MRALCLSFALFLAPALLATPAAAEPARPLEVEALLPRAGSLSVLLRETQRASVAVPPLPAAHLPSAEPKSEAGEEPELTLAIERMWSQVRAYRRPGGAEVILRGQF